MSGTSSSLGRQSRQSQDSPGRSTPQPPLCPVPVPTVSQASNQLPSPIETQEPTPSVSAPTGRRVEEGFSNAAASIANNVRQTVEYRAAWDLELWRAIQASKLRQQLETQKKKALTELSRLVKTREQQAVAGLEMREQEVSHREQRLAEEEKQMERRKWRLVEMEKDVRLLRQQLVDARRRAGTDAKVEVRRAKEDADHAIELQEQRVLAAEAQAKRADERLQQAQRGYLALSEEFHRFRTRELTSPPEKLSTVEARMRSEFVMEQQNLQDRLERRHQERLQQVEDRCSRLQEENSRLTELSIRRKEQLRRSADEIDRLKQLNRELEERLRKVGQKSLSIDSAADVKERKRCQRGVASPSLEAQADPDIAALVREVERLRSERRIIVETSAGALDEDSDVVRSLDKRINDILDQLRAHGTVSCSIAV